MAGKRKEFNRDGVITSLTTAHEGCDSPDQSSFTAEELDHYDDQWLREFRSSIKQKRRAKVTSTPVTRETFSKTGRLVVPIPIVLDEPQRKAMAAAGCKTAASVGAYLLEHVTSTKEEGAGESFFIPKDDRPEGGTVTFNANKLVEISVDGIADRSLQNKRNNQMRSTHDQLVDVQKRQVENNDPSVFTDDHIRNMLSRAAERLEYTPAQISACLAFVYGE